MFFPFLSFLFSLFIQSQQKPTNVRKYVAFCVVTCIFSVKFYDHMTTAAHPLFFKH